MENSSISGNKCDSSLDVVDFGISFPGLSIFNDCQNNVPNVSGLKLWLLCRV